MLLALDVGNTNIVIGFLDASGIRNIARLEPRFHAGADDERLFARQLHDRRPHRVQDRRHDRRDDDALNGLQVDLVATATMPPPSRRC